MQGVEIVRLMITIICITNVVMLLFYLILLVTARTDMIKSIQCLKMLPSPVIINFEQIKVF